MPNRGQGKNSGNQFKEDNRLKVSVGSGFLLGLASGFLLGLASGFGLLELLAELLKIDVLWLLLGIPATVMATFVAVAFRIGLPTALWIWLGWILATPLGWATAWGILIIADEIGIGAISYIF